MLTVDPCRSGPAAQGQSAQREHQAPGAAADQGNMIGGQPIGVGQAVDHLACQGATVGVVAFPVDALDMGC